MDCKAEKDWYEGCTKSQKWRLNHLYYILDKSGQTRRFRMNWAQEQLFDGLHYRNIVLKARQLGMSTLISMMILDNCLFRRNFNAAIVDKTLPDAKGKLQKIKFAFECMRNTPPHVVDDPVTDPEARRKIALYSKAMTEPEGKETKNPFGAESAEFGWNGSRIEVSTSKRGGTCQFIHVSEFGYTAATNPMQAAEIRDGAGNAVGAGAGIIIYESTHEGGKWGLHYEMLKQAMNNRGKKLTPLDYRFFFFPWWGQPEYRLEGGKTDEMRDYFLGLEAQGVKLDDEQKAWYVKQAQVYQFSMRKEYPSTPEEAFARQVDGAIYGEYIMRLRAEGKLAWEGDPDPHFPLYVSWDLGLSDYMALWLIQPGAGGKFYVIDYYCANQRPVNHYVNKCRDWEAKFGMRIFKHVLPHDASHQDWSKNTFAKELQSFGFFCSVVPKTADVWTGVAAVREMLPSCVFHRRCSEPVTVEGKEYRGGIDALENYKSGETGRSGIVKEMPVHDDTSHGADAFRTFAEAFKAGQVSKDTAHSFRINGEKRAVRVLGIPDYWN